MKFLLDESVDFLLAAFLQRLGHDVTTIVRDYPQSLHDRDVLATADREGRILVTNDHDFGELVFRQRLPNSGVMQLRLEHDDLDTKMERLGYVLAHHSEELRHFLTVTESGVRVRRTADR